MMSMNFPNGMTVAELKKAIAQWPELRDDGTPTEVWIGDGRVSNQVFAAWTLNLRTGQDGQPVADILLTNE